MNYIYNLLRGCKAFHNLRAESLFADLIYKIFRDFEVYVGVKECHTHFAHCVLDILFVKLSVTFQLAENLIQF